MARVQVLVFLVVALVLGAHSAAGAHDDDEVIIGVWERETEKDELEETWVIKKTKDKWSVSGTFWKRGQNGEVGNFKGKDVKYADGTLTFTQDYFKVPKGREDGTTVTASAEGNRLDIILKVGDKQTKDTMARAGDASELLGTWSTITLGMRETWIFEKDKTGALSVRGTFKKKDGTEVGDFKGTNVRYFKRVLWFNQEFNKIPKAGNISNGSAIACAGRGNELTYIWTNGKASGKAKMAKEDGK